MIRYACETWPQLRDDPEFKENVEAHFAEVAPGTEPLDIDDRNLSYLCINNMLQVVTVRDDGLLIGYHVTICRRHMHRAVLSGYVDAFYLNPRHRNGRVGMKMMQYAEEMLARRGVKWIYSGSKNSCDCSRLMEHLGYKDIEHVYLKVLP